MTALGCGRDPTLTRDEIVERVREARERRERSRRPLVLRLAQPVDPDAGDAELACRLDVVEQALGDVDVVRAVGPGLLAEHLPVALGRLVRADLGGDDHSLKGDADGDHRGVDQVAIGVGEDRELPAAVARFGERGGHIVEDGPRRKRASERAGLSFGESQTLLFRETLESEREYFAIGGAWLRRLNLGLDLVEAGEQTVGVLDAEHFSSWAPIPRSSPRAFRSNRTSPSARSRLEA